jgi:hypothetical protein
MNSCMEYNYTSSKLIIIITVIVIITIIKVHSDQGKLSFTLGPIMQALNLVFYI